jgi:hypothetical protein
MGRLAREPHLHIHLLGAARFALHRAVAGPGEDPGREIVVGRGRIEALAETFARTWQRPPTAAELDGLVADWVRDEVFYREAVALGLDRDDTVVRRRMRQKLEFLAEDADGAPPTDAELAAHLGAHAGEFRFDDQLTFTQIFLDPSRRGAALPADAAALLAALRERPESVDLETAGDGLLLEPRYVDASQTDVARHFGPEFAEALRAQPAGVWFGPVESGYGWHLVRIDARTPGRAPELAEVRDAVARDWEARRRQSRLDARYEELKRGYRVRIETAGP